jgi:hypothetical protein
MLAAAGFAGERWPSSSRRPVNGSRTKPRSMLAPILTHDASDMAHIKAGEVAIAG